MRTGKKEDTTHLYPISMLAHEPTLWNSVHVLDESEIEHHFFPLSKHHPILEIHSFTYKIVFLRKMDIVFIQRSNDSSTEALLAQTKFQ